MLNKYLDYTKLKSNKIYPQVLKKESHYKIWYGGHLYGDICGGSDDGVGLHHG